MQVESLSYAIKDKWILKNIHLELQKGEIGFLFGRNGSGKTTLLNLIAGVLKPTEGNIQISDSISDESVPDGSALSESVFYLPATPYLDGDLMVSDVYDILDCDQYLIRKNQKILQTDHLNDKSIAQISSGEYKRVWLAATLSVNCEIFLLDEPLVHLDWPFQKVLQVILKEMSLQGHSFLITTHNFNWTLGFKEAFAWILPPPFQKYPILEALISDKFKDVFQCLTHIDNNPLNGDKILVLS